MRWLFLHVLNVFFPQSEDEKRIVVCTDADFCRRYSERVSTHCVTLSSFADPIVRSAIHLNKFHNHTHAQKLLAALVRTYFESHKNHTYMVLPIPLSKARIQERGHNQVVSVLEKAVLGLSHVTLETDILVRNRNTPPQTSLSRKERMHNIHGAFAIDPRYVESVTGTHILLVDDVMTTGTTLHEAKATLLPHKPASITCLAFSH